MSHVGSSAPVTHGDSTNKKESAKPIYLYFALPLSILLLAATILNFYAEQRGNRPMAQSAAIVQVSCVVIAIIGFAILRRRKDSEAEKKNEWLIRLVVVTGLGMCVIAFYSIQWNEGRAIQIAGVGILAGGATWLMAAVVGFLFGIPHSRETGQTNQSQPGLTNQSVVQQSSNQYRPSTSLEQVSDWLTKIIVGVGLTQLINLRPSLDALASYIATGMGDPALHKSFALAICLYFPPAGFLFGFLWARLYMLEAFQLAEAEALAVVKRGIEADIDKVKEDFLGPLAEPGLSSVSALTAQQATLDETDRNVLLALAESGYRYRYVTGVRKAVPELTIDDAEKRLSDLVSRGLAGRTVRPSDKKELWYITSDGRQALTGSGGAEA